MIRKSIHNSSLIPPLRPRSFPFLGRLQGQKFSTTATPTSSTTPRGENRTPLPSTLEEVNNNFKLESIEEFKDFNFRLFKYRHTILGTPHYHIDTKDTNNVFAINFKTDPDDHTGKPHILEHLALCGS